MTDADEQLLSKPIIIIGAPRSGTNILLNTLAAHRSLAMLPEPRNAWRYGNDRRSDLLRPEDARPEVIRYVRAHLARRTREQGGVRFIEKTPSNALRPAFVERIFPDCLFLNIIRDGRDAVLSIRDTWNRLAGGFKGLPRGRWILRVGELQPRRVPYYLNEILRRAAPARLQRLTGRPLWGPRLPGMQELLRDVGLLGVSALQWRLCVELACQYGRTLPPDRYMEIRLEELSEEVLGRVIRFCQLDEDPAIWKSFAEEFDPSQAGARKSQADPAEIREIMSWIEPTMRWLGYSD